MLCPVTDLWRSAKEASERFSRQALQYDRCRPRYPAELFECILAKTHLQRGDSVVEIGAGTGIATLPLDERGLAVIAVEPAEELAELAQAKVAGRTRFVLGRFEECSLPEHVSLVTSFNAWHWVQPEMAVERAAQLLTPGAYLALVWTEVLNWGDHPFEERLADIFGGAWPKVMPHVAQSMERVSSDGRFGQFQEFHFPFERNLDGASYVAVTQTYGGQRTPEQYEALEHLITNEFGGAVTKREDAVLYLSQRL